jgi:hypothetical protein
MAPHDDVERPRASSAAERQKSIVSMTEFEGMDEYTALQKYILFYRDTRTNPHAEKTTKKKAWWQFWKSGSATAAAPIEDSGAVPDERKFSPPSSSAHPAAALHHTGSAVRECSLCFARPHASGGLQTRPVLKLLALGTQACAAAAVDPIRGDPPIRSSVPTKLSPAVQHAR